MLRAPVSYDKGDVRAQRWRSHALYRIDYDYKF